MGACACLLSACQPVTKDEFGKIFGPAFMHAIGHIAANISFAAVAISLTHTVKTLEPAFNVILSQCVASRSLLDRRCCCLVRCLYTYSGGMQGCRLPAVVATQPATGAEGAFCT